MKIYKSIDGKVALTSNGEFITDIVLAPCGSFHEDHSFAKAIFGSTVLFEGLANGERKLGDDDDKIVVWYQSGEELREVARYEPLPEILNTLAKAEEWVYGRYPFAPMHVGCDEVVIILPDSYEGIRRQHASRLGVLGEETPFGFIKTKNGVAIGITTPKRLADNPIEGITAPTQEAVEEIFRYYENGVINLISSDITFGSNFDYNGDWAECINIPIWHSGHYDDELLPAKQMILRAFRKKFGFVPIIRFTFGS